MIGGPGARGSGRGRVNGQGTGGPTAVPVLSPARNDPAFAPLQCSLRSIERAALAAAAAAARPSGPQLAALALAPPQLGAPLSAAALPDLILNNCLFPIPSNILKPSQVAGLQADDAGLLAAPPAVPLAYGGARWVGGVRGGPRSLIAAACLGSTYITA
jgi:hypothetical protein